MTMACSSLRLDRLVFSLTKRSSHPSTTPLSMSSNASDHPLDHNAQQINERIKDRIEGELVYLSGESLISSTTLNKSIHQSLLNETHVYTEDEASHMFFWYQRLRLRKKCCQLVVSYSGCKITARRLLLCTTCKEISCATRNQKLRTMQIMPTVESSGEWTVVS